MRLWHNLYFTTAAAGVFGYFGLWIAVQVITIYDFVYGTHRQSHFRVAVQSLASENSLLMNTRRERK